jgi:hypothetical protein
MAKPKRQARAKQFVPLALTAMVKPRGTGLRSYSQAEACESLDVTDRTLRNWAAKGLPTREGPHGKPVYPVPDVNVWAACYKVMVELDRHGRGPSHLSMAKAHRWHLQNQMQDWPEAFVVVPLDWDHPMREAALQVAAAGIESDPSDD